MTNTDQEIEDLLRENVRLARENNHLLHKIWNAEVTSFWGKALFYIVLIGVPVFVYQYYLESYVKQLRNTFDTMRGTVEQVRDLPAIDTLPAAVIQKYNTE